MVSRVSGSGPKCLRAASPSGPWTSTTRTGDALVTAPRLMDGSSRSHSLTTMGSSVALSAPLVQKRISGAFDRGCSANTRIDAFRAAFAAPSFRLARGVSLILLIIGLLVLIAIIVSAPDVLIVDFDGDPIGDMLPRIVGVGRMKIELSEMMFHRPPREVSVAICRSIAAASHTTVLLDKYLRFGNAPLASSRNNDEFESLMPRRRKSRRSYSMGFCISCSNFSGADQLCGNHHGEKGGFSASNNL